MRTILTWGLVAAVAALGLAAGIDALRGGEELEPVAATTGETEAVDPPTDLERAGVPAGRLVYSDEDCGAHSLLLPDLADRPVHDLVACQSEGVAFSQPGGVRAECGGGLLRIWAGPLFDPELVARERGCAPAWKPDRTVTFVQDGGVRRFAPCPGDAESAPLRCSTPVLTRRELARRLPGSYWRHAFPRVKELRWLGDERFAAIVQRRTPEEWIDFLALFDRGKLVGRPVGPYSELGGLTASPTGRRVAAVDTEHGGIVAIGGDGRRIRLALESGHGIAWSPDEEWVAEATEDGIYVWRADDEIPDLVRIPVVARDLLWTGPSGGADAVAEARAALQAAGVPRGRLVYADGDCRNHTLELPGLVASPAGYEGLCRYRAVAGGLVDTQGPPRSPNGRVTAECDGGTLTLWQSEFGVDEPHLVARARGCGAAWKPDGTVTFVQDGEIRRFVRCPGDGQGSPLRCSEPVLTRAGLAQLGRVSRLTDFAVEEHHWLNDERLAAIVSSSSAAAPEYLLVFRHGRMVQEPTFQYADLEGLRPSPSGRFVAAYEPGRRIHVVDRTGEAVDLVMNRGRGISWSPDEEWIAEATVGGIWLFRADGSGPAPIRIPIPAVDVLWTRP